MSTPVSYSGGKHTHTHTLKTVSPYYRRKYTASIVGHLKIHMSYCRLHHSVLVFYAHFLPSDHIKDYLNLKRCYQNLLGLNIIYLCIFLFIPPFFR